MPELNSQNAKWSVALAAEAHASSCMTIGLVGGSRVANDRHAVEQVVGQVTRELQRLDASDRCLLLHAFTDTSNRGTAAAGPLESRIPVAQRSPVGPWFEVALQTTPGGSFSDSTTACLRSWLPVWKQSFRLIMVDLGPVHEPNARALGRLCDGSYLLLGPAACGSQEWIMQQIAWHNQSGSIICGSLVVSTAQTLIAA